MAPLRLLLSTVFAAACGALASTAAQDRPLGLEVGLARHLANGEERRLSTSDLLTQGEKLFTASWTVQEGAGRPLSKGTGSPLVDAMTPLTFPRNFNRLSAPDANACSGCHNNPFGIAGGGGDGVTNVFVLAQRFDFAEPGNRSTTRTAAAVDEVGRQLGSANLGNPRATTGLFGAGYLEMLARQITLDLRTTRDRTHAGERLALESKGISFGTIARRTDGSWDTSDVEGLPEQSVRSSGPNDPPSLMIQPWHQASGVISLRQFANNAFNHHHGIQSEERFGRDVDADGDGFSNELTVGDVTAVSLFQAAMAVPGRVIPRERRLERAIADGESTFARIACTRCHIPALPLDRAGWIYTEPSPLNPRGNLAPGEAPPVRLDLTDSRLPPPRLRPVDGIVMVPAFTDFKLHDICNGPDDPNREPLNMNVDAGSPEFFAGNSRFLTKRLWGAANEPPYFHHGKFTTLREAVLAHDGEARASKLSFVALSGYNQGAVIEFLKSLQVLRPGTKSRVVDQQGGARDWPSEFARLTGSRR